MVFIFPQCGSKHIHTVVVATLRIRDSWSNERNTGKSTEEPQTLPILIKWSQVYPTKMMYPVNLPLNSLLETLHRDKTETSRRLKLFYWGFGALFIWELFPEWIMPVTTGISIFCLAKRNSLVFTNLFGGSNGNEGLGILSFCMDWNYVTSTPMWLPLQSLFNNMVGYILCVCVFMGVFYMNIWRAQDFPFLSQLLFDGSASNSSSYAQYNQTAILSANNEIIPSTLDVFGIPYFASTYVTYLLTTNMAITATLTHLLLWNFDDMKTAWSFISWKNLKRLAHPFTWHYRFWESAVRDEEEDTSHFDPHYKLMLAYSPVPSWWFGLVLIGSILVGLICIYEADSTLPWWGFFISCILATICILFFGAQYAITGFSFIIQPIIQMIGGYCHPGKPLANMYFVLYGYNSVSQGQLLLRDLKFGQYAKLSPRCTFTAQMVGTVIGAIFNYVMMLSITTNQREVLLSIEGTNIWSGQNVQQYNSQVSYLIPKVIILSLDA